MSRLRRALVLLSWLAAMGIGAVLIARAQFSADLSAFLPAAPDAAQRVLIEQLHGGVPARTLLLAIDGGSASQRVEASRRLAAALRAQPLFEQVQNGGDGAWRSIGEWVLEHRYLLSPGVDAQRFTADGLRDAIDDTLSLLGTPAGQRVKAVIERDPTGELVRIAENSLPTDGPRSEQGVWVSRDGERAVLMLIVRAAGSDLDAQAHAIGRVEAAFAALEMPQLHLRLSGAPKFAVDSRAQIETEARHLAIAGTVLVGALLLLAFGSASAVGVAMLPVVSGVVAGIAAVALCFGTVFGMTLGFGSTLIGEAVDYGIYFLIQSGAGAGAQTWIRRSWPTVRLGLLASLCGFGALAFSGFPGLAQLGVFSMAGLAGAAMTTRFVLPLLAPRGATGTRLRHTLGRAAMRVLPRMPRLRTPLTLLGIAAAALLAWQHQQLWGQDLSSLSPVPPEAIRFDESLRADLSSSEGGTLVIVQAADAEGALRAAEQAAVVLDRLVAQGILGGYQSAARLLPSVHTQRTRLAALPDTPTLHIALAQATAGGPLPAQRLQPFIDDVQRARQLEPLRPASLAGTALAPLLDALLLKRADGSWAALLPLQAGATPLDPAALRAALNEVPAAQVLEIPRELRRLYRHYLREAQMQALLGALAVLALIAAGLRSWQRVRAVCQPLLLAVLLLMAALHLLAVPMGILHLVGLLLVVALGSNYALFLNAPHGAGDTNEDTLASLLLVSLTTATSFGLIALSAIPALSSIGQVVAPGTLLVLLLVAAHACVDVPAQRPRSDDTV